MSEPLNRPPPDLGAYVDLRIFDVPSQELVDAMSTLYAILNPGWIARESGTEVLLMEAIALATAENIAAINRLPGAVVEATLRLAGVERDFGAPATATATVTLADGLGYTIPTGTRFYLQLASGTVVFLSEAPDVQIPPGEDTAEVNLITQINTAAANGVGAGARLVLADQLHMVQTVVLSSTVVSGRDPETDAEWRDRGVARLRRLSDALVVPRQFVAAIDEDPRIGRVIGIDLWDGSVVTPGDPGDDPGHFTLAVLDPDGLEHTTEVLEELEATVEALAAAMLDVHVVNAVLDDIDVVATIRTKSGFVAATVAASVATEIRRYVNPVTWPATEPLRHNEFVSVIDQVPGVDYVVTVTLNASTGDVALSEPRALPNADVVTITEAS